MQMRFLCQIYIYRGVESLCQTQINSGGGPKRILDLNALKNCKFFTLWVRTKCELRFQGRPTTVFLYIGDRHSRSALLYIL